MISRVGAAAGFAAVLVLGVTGTVRSVLAQTSKPDAAKVIEELTPEEKQERELRKACKVQICSAFHVRKADGADIACNVLKTWRKEQLSKMIERAKVSWPWGNVKCVADIKLKRADLIKAMTEDKHEAQLDAHQVACEIAREGEEKAEIKFAFSPKVSFEKGKAVKAALNWGKIEAPTLVKGAMWTATATDNTFNVLQGTIVEDINDFIGPKCDEVKDAWGK
jgi:hypothetical protein